MLALAAAGLPQRARAGDHDPFIPPGYRAMPLPVENYELQFVKKGDRIDVLTTFKAKLKGGATEFVTATLLQNVLVSDAKEPVCDGRPGAVLVLLNPNEGQYLTLALKSRKIISIVLRAKDDNEMHPMQMASFSKLFR